MVSIAYNGRVEAFVKNDSNEDKNRISFFVILGLVVCIETPGRKKNTV